MPTSEIGIATHWDDRRPPALQEQVDHADRPGAMAIEDRDDDLVDRLADEGRGIIDVDVVDAWREALLQLRHLVPDRLLDLDHVRALACAMTQNGAEMRGGPHKRSSRSRPSRARPVRYRGCG